MYRRAQFKSFVLCKLLLFHWNDATGSCGPFESYCSEYMELLPQKKKHTGLVTTQNNTFDHVDTLGPVRRKTFCGLEFWGLRGSK